MTQLELKAAVLNVSSKLIPSGYIVESAFKKGDFENFYFLVRKGKRFVKTVFYPQDDITSIKNTIEQMLGALDKDDYLKAEDIINIDKEVEKVALRDNLNAKEAKKLKIELIDVVVEHKIKNKENSRVLT